MAIFIWFVLPVLLILLGILLLYNFPEGGTIIIILGILVLFFTGIVGPINRVETRAMLKKMEAVQVTLNASREKGVLENLSITENIIKYNTDLASAKYWNTSKLFDIFIPDEVDDAPYIE